MAVSACIGLTGVGLGYYFYVVNTALPKKFYDSFQAIHRILFNKYYVDEIYEALIVNPLKKTATFCWKIIDVMIVDGIILMFARVSRFTGEVSRLFQTGSIQVYAVFILMGLIVTVGYLIYGIHH
jgi:NADH-quinone oxidoreductase subunit L